MQAGNAITIPDVAEAIRDTIRNGLLNDRRAEGLSGLAGARTVGLLQRLVRLFEDTKDACYLEIGVFQGLTLVSTAVEAPGLPCYGIDNFATLDPQGENLSMVQSRIEKFGVENTRFINADFEDALENLGDHLGDRKIGVYLIDGPHDYRSQLVCLTLAQPFLRDDAVIVIDDANYPDVRWSTRDFLMAFPEYSLLFDAYSPDHPANMDPTEKRRFEESWLNGIHVLVRDPEHSLSKMLPPISETERTLYLNEWLVHRLRYAELAPEALRLADAVISGEGESEAREALLSAAASSAGLYEGRHSDRNLYSADLPTERLDPQIS